jgi:hypothetical protein
MDTNRQRIEVTLFRLRLWRQHMYGLCFGKHSVSRRILAGLGKPEKADEVVVRRHDAAASAHTAFIQYPLKNMPFPTMRY